MEFCKIEQWEKIYSHITIKLHLERRSLGRLRKFLIIWVRHEPIKALASIFGFKRGVKGKRVLNREPTP